MWRPRGGILLERKFAKLGHDLAQRFLYSVQTRTLCFAICFCDALEESLPERITTQTIPPDLIAVLQQLGNQMKVGNRTQIVSKEAELLVSIGFSR